MASLKHKNILNQTRPNFWKDILGNRPIALQNVSFFSFLLKRFPRLISTWWWDFVFLHFVFWQESYTKNYTVFLIIAKNLNQRHCLIVSLVYIMGCQCNWWWSNYHIFPLGLKQNTTSVRITYSLVDFMVLERLVDKKQFFYGNFYFTTTC
jgi:hypothetical protein